MVVLCLATSAAAQTSSTKLATTYVAPTKGNDSDGCTKTKPCKTIAAALLNTREGGAVILTEAAEKPGACLVVYDNVIISKSVTIKPTRGLPSKPCFTPGSLDSSFIVDGANIKVKLKSMKIDYGGGHVGIRFLNGATLEIDDFFMDSLNEGIIQARGHSMIVTKSVITASRKIRIEDETEVGRTAELRSTNLAGHTSDDHCAVEVGTNSQLLMRGGGISGEARCALKVNGAVRLINVRVSKTQGQ